MVNEGVVRDDGGRDFVSRTLALAHANACLPRMEKPLTKAANARAASSSAPSSHPASGGKGDGRSSRGKGRGPARGRGTRDWGNLRQPQE